MSLSILKLVVILIAYSFSLFMRFYYLQDLGSDVARAVVPDFVLNAMFCLSLFFLIEVLIKGYLVKFERYEK
ncbi:hypothetical protein P4H08_19050 [Bacillus cereus]|nr:hypothetical protein [Bacillus cereus]